MDKLRIGMIGSQFAARLHLNNLAKRVGKRRPPSEPYIDVPYHVVDDGKPKKEPR